MVCAAAPLSDHPVSVSCTPAAETVAAAEIVCCDPTAHVNTCGVE
jgi:hypothetical protein